MYSINVFLTFSLSQLGMTRLWWHERRDEPRWKRHLADPPVGAGAVRSASSWSPCSRIHPRRLGDGAAHRASSSRSASASAAITARRRRGCASSTTDPSTAAGQAGEVRPASIPARRRRSAGQLRSPASGCTRCCRSTGISRALQAVRLRLRGGGRLRHLQGRGGDRAPAEQRTEDDLEKVRGVGAAQGFEGHYRSALGTEAVRTVEEVCTRAGR